MTPTRTPTPLAAVLDERSGVQWELRHTRDILYRVALRERLDALNREAARLIARFGEAEA